MASQISNIAKNKLLQNAMTPHSDPFTKAKKQAESLYPFFEFGIYGNNLGFTFRLSCVYRLTNASFKLDLDIDHSQILGAVEPELMILDCLLKLAEQMLVGLGENVTGKYPFTRLWADLHLVGSPNTHIPELLFEPHVNVPGWVHNRFRNQDIYPKEGSITTTLPMTVESEGGTRTINKPPKIKPEKKSTPLLGITTEDFMAEVKKKKVVRTHKKMLDPNRVKADSCMKHNVEMEFNPIRGLWECTVDGCRVIARPKRDSEDRTVTVGKGGVQARLISHKGDITLLLISDDNIALDITRFVDIENLMDRFDVTNQAKLSSENGKDQFSIPAKAISLNMALVVMGADELALLP